MKKIFTLLVAVFFVAATFAQTRESVQVPFRTDNKKAIEKAGSSRSVDFDWISYADYLYWSMGGTQQLSLGAGNILCYDTLGLTQFVSEYDAEGNPVYVWDHPWILSCGQVYDFEADFYDMVTPEGYISFTQSPSYNIDSIEAGGLYLRWPQYSDDIIDTLIVSILPDVENNFDVYDYSSVQYGCTYDIYTDTDNGGYYPLGNPITFKHPIGPADVSEFAGGDSWYLTYVHIPVDVTNITSKVLFVSYTFKPGHDRQVNDTLDNLSQWNFTTILDPGTGDLAYYGANPLPSRCENLSHGEYVCNSSSGILDYYRPSFLWERMHYPNIAMHVTSDDPAIMGVTDQNKEAMVYPNPATDQITVNTNSNEKVLVEMFNLVGQKVYSDQVVNSTKIDVSNFQAGVYMLKVNNQTVKVVVR